MYIEYDEFELLELFESEPDSLSGNMEDGEISYTSKKDSGFELTIFIYTYQQECGIYLSHNEREIFSASLKEISKIIQKDNALYFESQEKKQLISIYFGDNFNIKMDGE